VARLARSATGEVLVGDEEGFVPLAAADPALESVDDGLRVAPAGLPDPGDATADRRRPADLAFGSPLPDPGKLWGIGLNYAEHAEDLDEVRPDEPASFMKPGTAATGPGGPIRLPPTEQSDRVTAEAELAVVIGRTCRDVAAEDADDVIAGFLPVIDMTAEDILERNPRFLTRAKSFDSFLVFGPWLTTTDEFDQLDDVEVRTVVDGEVKSRNVVANMLFDPHELVSFHSKVMTLQPGDVISTGTPGAYPIEPGNVVRAEVDGLGSVEADVVR
jgi:2-keto-4-pentenoate hydratase/2-oxohepta-3-ene-1,7-dioic acid hydratase in catechol pathway